MINRFGNSKAILATAILALAAPVFVFLGLIQAARAAPSADLALCDRLAADPSDPDRPADVKGVTAIAASDTAQAIHYCKTAASGSRRALYQLGRAYAANGQMSEAVAAYRKAADKGSSSAMVELGVLSASGTAVPKDTNAAHGLFERAAQAGNARGVINLVALADAGGPPMDPAQARALLTRAVAETGSAEGQFQLGLMEANGTGGPKDDAGARALFEKAAAQNHPGALEWAGNFAENGRGGPKDKNAAKSYYERAIALGNENAKAGLERLNCPLQLSDKKGKRLTTLCF